MTLGQVLWRSVDDLQRRSVTGQPGCWYSVMYSTSKAIFNSFHEMQSALSVKISPNMPKNDPWSGTLAVSG